MSEIRRRLHLASPPESVWDLLATDAGRARFWAEETWELDGRVAFRFPNGTTSRGQVLSRERPARFALGTYDPERTWSQGYCDN